MNSKSPEYKLGKTIFGSSEAIAKSYEIFAKQKIDEVRLLQNGVSGYSSFRTTLKGESSVVGVGTFEGSSKQSITFAPSKKPGWWIRRMDQPQQLDTLIDISNLWTSAQNLVMRSGSPHNYLRMVEHIVALKLGLGLDDVLIKVNSGDPPLFDQSSVPLIETVDSAEMTEKDEKVSFVTVKEPVAFGGQRGDFLLFIPAEKGDTTLRIDCAIKWNTVIGEQRVLFDVSPDVFRYAAFARTNATYKQYVLAKTVGKFFAATRNWGYNKKNILIHGKKGFFNEPRFPVDGKFLEPVWHRATLDLMAALSLTGADRFAGTVVSYRAGHTLDCDAIRALYRNDLLCSV